MLSREGNGVVDGFERDFKLQHDAIDRLQSFGSGINVDRLECVVGSLHHQNAVLSVGLDKDWGHATGESLNLLHMGCIDVQFLEILDCGRTKQVAADSRDHENIRAAEAGSNRLVRTLAAETKIEFLSE